MGSFKQLFQQLPQLHVGCVTPVCSEPCCFSSSSTAPGGCTRNQAWRRLSATGPVSCSTQSTRGVTRPIHRDLAGLMRSLFQALLASWECVERKSEKSTWASKICWTKRNICVLFEEIFA